MNSKKSISPSRSSHRASPRSRAASAKRSHVALTKHASSSPKSSQAGREAAPVVPLARRVLQKMKTKTGIAVAAGAVLAGLGLARKLRAAH